jgi:hypothetical protein
MGFGSNKTLTTNLSHQNPTPLSATIWRKANFILDPMTHIQTSAIPSPHACSRLTAEVPGLGFLLCMVGDLDTLFDRAHACLREGQEGVVARLGCGKGSCYRVDL